MCVSADIFNSELHPCCAFRCLHWSGRPNTAFIKNTFLYTRVLVSP